MQTVTFYCPHCRNLMGVAAELLGHQVQCPTCHQIVIAPAPPVNEPLVSFDEPAKKKEGEESIFGEHHDEDLFGSRPPKVEVPGDQESITTPAIDPSSSASFTVYPPGTPQPDAALEATVDAPPADFAMTSANLSEPVLAPDHWPTAVPDPEAPPAPPGGDGFSAPAPAAWSPTDDAPPIEVRRRGPTREQSRGNSLLLAILAPYAVIMTLVAGYYFYKARWDSGSNDHPLANIPDATALFDPPTRKQLSKRMDFMPPVDAPLPESLKVQLGQTLQVGDLEVTPEKITRGPVAVHTIMQNNEQSVTQLPGEALLLHLRVKNRSSDVYFCPTDPVYERWYESRRGSSKPYNQVVVGNQRFYGGAIDVLSVNWGQVKRKYIAGQENDAHPLPPGEERRTLISTDPQDAKLYQTLATTAADTPLQWRVQLRRGLTEYRGRDYPVSAVIGVQFTKNDIQP